MKLALHAYTILSGVSSVPLGRITLLLCSSDTDKCKVGAKVAMIQRGGLVRMGLDPLQEKDTNDVFENE